MSIRKGQVIVAGAGNTRRNIGEVYYSQSSLATDNSGALPLWTGESVATAMYPSLTEWVTKHTELQCTAEEYETSLSTYGECPKYVLSTDSLRLPKLANYIKMANGIDGITQSLEGLPDHTHTTNYSEMRSGDTNSVDCWRGTTEVQTGPASESNPIYGRNEHVTPAHTTLYPWVVAYTSAIEASVAQAAEFQEGLSGKVDLPAGVTNDNVDYVIESYNDGANWYRVYKSGWVEQGGEIPPPETPEVTVSLLKPYADTNYTLMVSIYNPNVISATHCREKTVSSFLSWAGTPTGAVANVTRVWRASGQGATA